MLQTAAFLNNYRIKELERGKRKWDILQKHREDVERGKCHIRFEEILKIEGLS